MHRPRVFADADVMYGPVLRGWMFNLSLAGAFDLLTTEDVISEAVANWRDDHPTAEGGVIARMSELMRTLCAVVRDYDCTIAFPGDDEGDIHVHAACVASETEYLVTKDRGFHDLDEAVKDSLKYEIYDIDDFLVLVHNQNPPRIRELTLKEIQRREKKYGDSQTVEKLAAAGAPQFAKLVSEHAQSLAGAGQLVYARS